MSVRVLGLSLGSVVALASSVASAQPLAPPSPAGRPTEIRVATPPPAPLRARTYHFHDGFYLRMSLGVGYTSAALSGYGGASSDSTASGPGGVLDLLLGGTPARGLTFGGGLLLDSIPNPSLAVGGQSRNLDRSMGYGLVGPFVDGFIDPKKGFHVGGMLGGAWLGFGTNADHDSRTNYQGAGMALWLGYDAWIADDWSLGGMLRLGGARVTRSESGISETATPRNISLLFTALYH